MDFFNFNLSLYLGRQCGAGEAASTLLVFFFIRYHARPRTLLPPRGRAPQRWMTGCCCAAGQAPESWAGASQNPFDHPFDHWHGRSDLVHYI